MNRVKFFLLSFSLLYVCFAGKAEKRKILFIGNSYTSVNDLPTTVKNLALSFGDSLEIDSNAPGGMTFNAHSTDATTLAKIAAGGWDYVVLQAQSQEPSFDPVQVSTDTYPYAKKLDSLIHVSNPCAETIFYMTWGRKNGDASNCAAYPPICTYAGMQQRLRESYLEMSLDNNATCSPVGVAWKRVRDLYPTIELYNPDESHPSVQGTYLIACTFYSSIYHKSSVGSAYLLSGVNASDASILQQVASSTVLDSIENWQQYGSLPKATYSFTQNQSQLTFTNQSLRSGQYEWNFGDGSAINTQVNPIHNYTSLGNYQVSLKAKNTCGKYDVYIDSVQVNAVLTTINETEMHDDFSLNYSSDELKIVNTIGADQLRIIDMNGQSNGQYPLQKKSNKIVCRDLPVGIYTYQAFQHNKLVAKGKFQVR